jgi:IS30 family transposase
VAPMSRSAVVTLVDRRSGFLRLVHLPEGHRAEHLETALRQALSALPSSKRLTLTWDQGSEMAHHAVIAKLFSQGVYFADPGCPWMRGTNENTNGLVRQYLPKGTDLRVHDADALAAVEAKLNDRPRKRLDWSTPAQIFAVPT